MPRATHDPRSSAPSAAAAIAIAASLAALAGCPRAPDAGSDAAPVGSIEAQASTNGREPSRDVAAAQDPTSPPAEATEVGAGAEAESDGRYALGFTVDRIEGDPEPLSNYKGRVLLVVNVASQCGLTPQYAALESLYARKRDEGLVVLGFPANNFGNQEPGSNREILEFCTDRFDVTFPMFAKISVTGEDQHPLYAVLSSEGGPPNWNFTKYLVDRGGRVVARFDPRTRPDDPALVAMIDELLAR